MQLCLKHLAALAAVAAATAVAASELDVAHPLRRLQRQYTPPTAIDLVHDLCGDTCQAAANMGDPNLALCAPPPRHTHHPAGFHSR